jgi:hypothetical protein
VGTIRTYCARIAIAEETKNTYKLAMNIAANSHWASYGLDIILLHEDFSCLDPVGTTGIQRGSTLAAASHEKMSNWGANSV